MILIGRGLDLGEREKGTGRREKEKLRAKPEGSVGGETRNRRRPEPETSEEMVCGRMSEERLKAALVRQRKELQPVRF